MNADISQDIIKLRKLINQLELLNSNPHIAGKQIITNTVQEIKIAVMQLEIQVANYAE